MLESSYLASLDIGAMLRSSNVLNTIVSGQGSAASGKNEYSFKVREITQGKQGVFGPESDEVKVDVPIRNTGDIDIRGVWKAKDMFSQFEGTVVISAGNFGYDYKIDTWESYPASGESQTTEYGRNKHNGVIELVLYLKEYGMPLTGNEALWSTMIINSENEIYRVAPAMVLHRVK